MTEALYQIAAPAPQERADATRNRKRVLAAAAKLFAEHGVDGVTMDAVAQEAGVGKGTVFRRFGDKSGLVAALLDDREREIQEAILRGPSPLGPGGESSLSGTAGTGGSGTARSVDSGSGEPTAPTASPAERRRAFVDAYLDYLVEHLELSRLSETSAPGARYRIGAYRFWHQHLEILFRSEGAADPDYRAHAVLALLDADLVHALRSQGFSWDRIRDGVHASVAAG